MPSQPPDFGAATHRHPADDLKGLWLKAQPPALQADVKRGAEVLAEPWPWSVSESRPGMIGPEPDSVADIDPAARIGRERRAILDLALSAPARLPPLPAWCPPRAYWVQCLAVGLVTAHLHREDRFGAFATGFLHDAGIPLLAASAPAAAEAAALHARAHGLSHAAAWAALNPDRPDAPAETAAAFAAAWVLDQAAAALAPTATGPLPARLRVARALVALRRMRAPCDGADPPLDADDLRAAGFTPDRLADLFMELAELTIRARRLLPLLRQGR